MALVEVVNYVATFLRKLLGIKEEEDNFDYSGLGKTTDSVDDLIDGMEEANEEVEKLKKNLIGIDELNILEPQEESATGDLMDPTIMAAFEAALKDWENRMDEVNMKAYEVRDAILSWVGLSQGEDGNYFLSDTEKRLGKILTYIEEAKQKIDEWAGIDPSGLPLFAAIGKLKDLFAKIWGYIDSLAILLFEMKFPALTGILKMFEGISEIINRGADFENIMDIVEGIGWILFSIGLTLGSPVFTGLGLAIIGISKTIDAILKSLEDGKISLDELDDILVGIGVTIVGLAISGKLKTIVGWLVACKTWVVNVGKAIIAAIGGNSAAASALTFLLDKLISIFGWASIITGTFAIFKNIAGWINGTIPPLQALFGILKGVAFLLMGIMALLKNWTGVAVATGFMVAAGIAESAVKKSYENKKDTSEEDKTELEVEVKTELETADKAISSTVEKLNVKSYAKGGYPDKGLFVMNEGSSAEMFGTINGKSAVVNNQEIASALASALVPMLDSVVMAVENVAANDRPIVLNVDSRQMARANKTGSQKLGYNQIGGEFANV